MQEKAFMRLVLQGINHIPSYGVSYSYKWDLLKKISVQQGLSAIVLDAIERLPESERPPKDVLLQWIGEVLEGYELRYDLYSHAIAELAGFYNSHCCKMMILKGYACSLNWPKPEHRPCGDIDIWLFGKQKEADELMKKEKGIKIDSSHHHHTVFYWQDFMVENHYDFINVHRHKSHSSLEDILKELSKKDSISEDVYGERIYLPPPNLHALFLARHALNHFASVGINLRQVLDWAFFVEKHSNEIDWEWLNSMLEQYHMKDFVNCLNAICVEDLGFNAAIFIGVQFNPLMKEKVLEDILNPENENVNSIPLISRLLYQYRRWKRNSWKRNLCYDETMMSGFWRGVRNAILRPLSI